MCLSDDQNPGITITWGAAWQTGLTHRRWLKFIVWPVSLCQSRASHSGKKTTLCISNSPGICEYSPPVLLQGTLTDSGRKIWYHCFPAFWNSGLFQTLDHDSTSLGTFEDVALCNQRSRLSCNFFLCLQTVGKMGFHNLSQTHNIIHNLSLRADYSFLPTKTEKLSLYWPGERDPSLFRNCVGI